MRTPRSLLRAAVAAALLAAAPAAAVQVATGSGAGLAGQTVDIALTVTNTTGLAIRSLQFDLQYNGSLVTATDVLEAGTLVGNAGWGDAAFDVDIISGSTRRIRVAAAGVNALTGSGTLLLLRFAISPSQLAATSTALTLTAFEFNEGSPNDTTSNGTLTINATPIITVSPNAATVVRGNTQAFSVFGSVTPPVNWFTTDPAIATISGSGVMTGVAPGSVRVFAVDAAGRRDTTDSDILVRGMSMTAGPASIFVSNSGSIPVTVSNLTGLGIRSGQFTINFAANRFTVTGVSTPPGTLLDGYGPVGFSSGATSVSVDFAGTSDLTGSGVLCYLDVTAGTQVGGVSLVFGEALFNEVLPAVTTTGTLTITGLPTLFVSPDQTTLLVGQTRQFTVSGGATAPLTWIVLDPAVGTISPGGLFTATQGGMTKVQVVDAVGANDQNTLVDVYDFRAELDTVSAPPGATVHIRMESDRALDPLGVYAAQYAVTFPSTHITDVTTSGAGMIGAWMPEVITRRPNPGRIEVTSAGAAPLAGGATMHTLVFTLSAAAPPGTDIPLTFASLLCNEGTPRAQIGNGLIRVRTTVDAPVPSAAALSLAPAWPNPARERTRLAYSLPQGPARVRLRIHGADGRVVRTLVDDERPAGPGSAEWDGADDRGGRVPAGLYFVSLDALGRNLTRKLAVVR